MPNPSLNSRALCFAVSAVLCAAGAGAQSLEEVIVSAQKQDESIQKTPISMAAFDEKILANMGFTNVSDLKNAVPNLSMRQMPSSKSAMRIYIRGVGNSDTQITLDPAIAVYADGIYIARSTGLTMEVADIERVEVLRGPQGTLYGRNATGGAINIISRRPSGEFGFKEQLTFGSRDLWRTTTTLDLPAVYGVSTKLSYLRGAIDGSVKNDGPGKDFGEDKSEAVRLALSWALNDDIVADYSFDRASIESGMNYNQTVNAPKAGYGAVPYSRHRLSHVTSRVPLEATDLSITGHSLIVSWDIGSELTIKSLTGYRKTVEDLYQDYSANPLTPRLFANDPLDSDSKQFSQEFQLAGTLAEPAIDYVAGVYYFSESGREFATDYVGLNLGAGIVELSTQTRATKAKNSAYAAFGQATWTPAILEERLHLTLGARYSADKREVEVSRLAALDGRTFLNVKADKSSNKPSLSGTVAFDITDAVNTYLKYSQGYRTGGFNGRSARASSVAIALDAETVEAWELGVKSQWFNNRVRVNAAAFWMDYDDIQLSFAPVGDPSDVSYFNAAKARISGIELDTSVALTDDLIASFNYGLLESRIKEVINPLTGLKPTVNFVLPGAPHTTYNADLDYTFPRLGFGTLSANINYSWTDFAWTASDPAATPYAKTDSYGLLNARLTLSEFTPARHGSVKVALWGKNLENKEYLNNTVGAFSWSNRVGTFGDPRSYGVDLTYQY